MGMTAGYRQTEIGPIPVDWLYTTVSATAALSLNAIVGGPFGSDLVSRDYVSDGVPVIRGQNMGQRLVEPPFVFVTLAKASSLAANLARPGDVVFTQRGTLGQVALVPNEPYDRYLISQSQMKVTLNRGIVDSQFFHFLFSGPIHQRLISANTIQTGVPHINLGVLRRIPIQLPPVSEQRAIAAALSDVDALIGSLDRLITKKRDLKKATMQQLLTGQTRLSGFAKKLGCKQTEVGVIPADWEVRPLLAALRIATGQVDPRTEPYKSMTLVAPDHIESATGRLLARQTAAEQKAISGKYLFAKGDVIYSKIRPYLRKAILAEFDGLCSADMYPLKPIGDVSAGFMLAVLLGHRFSIFAESVSVRSGMPKINRTEIAEYSLALPPSSEQAAIAAVLSDMDTELAALEQRRDKTRLLKQGMMQELLTGRTRLV